MVAGSRDEFGLDDIGIEATFESLCDLTGTGLADVHCEDTEETGNDDTDDYLFPTESCRELTLAQVIACLSVAVLSFMPVELPPIMCLMVALVFPITSWLGG